MLSLLKLSILATTAAATGLGGGKYGNHTYDYIIVGGGAAGTALATRLSQTLINSSILLIEAGPAAPDALGINVPGMLGSTQGGPYDWNLTSTPQPNLEGRSIDLSRGKVLGGSSAMNYMVWNRASAPEYDAWEPLGNPGWNWTTMLAGMMKSENFTGIDSPDYGHIGRGTTGPVHNVVDRYRSQQVLSWIPTLENLGIVHNLESLGGEPLGVMLQPTSVNPDNYMRSYSANSYLPKAGPSLDVMLSTRVAKVNFPTGSKKMPRASLVALQNLEAGSEGGGLTATGVTLQDGTVIDARKEVILSAGSLQSPGLLELSGIGQKAVLDTVDIEQIIDLPGVGENLQDHNGITISYQLKPNYTSLDTFRYNTTYAAEQLALWKDGQFSRYDTTYNSISFLNWQQIVGNDSTLTTLAQQAIGNSTDVTDKTKLSFLSDPSVPQIELILADGTIGAGYPSEDDPLYGSDFVSIAAIAMRPLNRGSVHIRSANISQDPAIDPRYASSEYDVQSIVASAKYVRKIAQTQPLADFLVGEYAPGLAAVSTDDEWAEYVRENLLTIYHYAGTCAMLPVEDGGVVDPQLRVWGTRNLRVVDASVVPVLVGSHTQTVTYGIAERAAGIIIEDFKE
ncbi:Pyranose dehydrogenase 3 [Cytospora mali]|uniref:Pyranose dehydrogenase 3 n=1 Tax=Cytospora mali TaxID=578113 RepID=A0A194VJ68_CYTMA|nr:Pyranose dehydrogenase 3 [Valsa mali]